MRRALGVVLLALVACKGGGEDEPVTIDLASSEYGTHPQVPTIFRDVAMIDDDAEFTAPYVPGHRTTMDGRVALRVQGGTIEVDRLSTNLSFFLFAPEKLDEPIMPGPSGANILASAEPFDVEFPPALDPDMYRLGHHAICDPTQEFPQPGEQTNPYPCGPATLDDCYDLTVISSTSPDLGTQLWGTPVTVQVTDPKTPQAQIADVTLGTPVMGAYIPASPEWTEPAITIDGRLMTGRLGRISRSWTHPETGETFNRPYDLAYAVLPEDAEPCDVTGWTDFHPMSHAPYDPQMVGRYGLAAYPFRDTEGQPIEDGEDMGGTYPWVDREGANVIMTGVPGRISEQSESRFPRRCVVAGCEDLEESVDFDRGFQIGGLWTHGKFVHLDGQINNIDWAVGVSPAAHWWVDLYEDEAGEPVQVRFGSGRFMEYFRQQNGPFPPGYTHNANILDSLEHLANFREAAKPVTPRDVVWLMSNGVATDEIAFDDLLDPNALIVSNMQASITQHVMPDGSSRGIPWHHNGQVRRVEGLSGLLATTVLEPEEDEEIHLQNGATSLDWEVPPYGFVEAGTGRVEPVALGGVEGRGFWLTGDNAVRYTMPRQPEVNEVDAYIGVFVDGRTPEGENRELFRFPDGTGIVLAEGRVTYVDGLEVVHTVDIPDGEGWMHLGWRLSPGHRTLTLLHEGFALDRFEADRPMFSLEGGDLVVGRHTSEWTGFRGWVDNLIVTAHAPNVEVACNHAKGTLVEIIESNLLQVAEGYPDWAHAEVADAAGSSEASFVCVQDHSDDYAVHLRNLPEGTRSVREAINFPEGPLVAGVPRPDSSGNTFCLSCHTEAGKGGLSVDALVRDATVTAEDDRRRQPLQPPRRVFGNIPAGWIPEGHGPGGPSEAMQAPPEGVVIDPWVLPAEE